MKTIWKRLLCCLCLFGAHIQTQAQLPVADFSASPISGIAPLNVAFRDLALGPVTSWEWNFGDSSHSRSPNPTHTFTTPGTYSVLLRVKGAAGSDTKNKADYVRILSQPPNVARAPGPTGPGGPPGGSVNRPLLRPALALSPSVLNFGAVASGASSQLTFDIVNPGWGSIELQQLDILLGPFGTAEAFTLELEGRTIAGTDSDLAHAFSPPITVGKTPIRATLTFAPTTQQFDSIALRFRGFWSGRNFIGATLHVDGLGGHEGDPFLHVVIDGEEWIADFDGDGVEHSVLRGSGSHTHEPGKSLVSYEWEIDGAIVSTSDTLGIDLPVGAKSMILRITDDDTPPKYLSEPFTVEVVTTSNIPGTLVSYYGSQGGEASLLLDSVPANVDYRERRADYTVGTIGGMVGGSPFSEDVMAQVEGEITVGALASYEFTAVGGSDHRIEVDGIPVSGPVLLTAGTHALEVRFAVDFLTDLPLEVRMATDNDATVSIPNEIIRHDESTIPPLIHSITPDIGQSAGGNTVVIDGFGFSPCNQVTLHWGDSDFTENDFVSISSTQIVMVTPPGGGLIGVSVSTGNGETPTHPFTYLLDGPVPISFLRTHIYPLEDVINAAWGPDGRLYVAQLGGQVTAIEFDEDYNIVSQATYVGVSELSNNDLIGIAFNPYDPPTPVRLYLGHGEHWANGGTTPTEPSPYSGQISTLDGPNFDDPIPLITGLPVSNHDHAINQIAFDNNGDLLISVGSMTNAGVKHSNHGDIPESPLSAAILKAHTSRPDFNGEITYVETTSQVENDDQRVGNLVDVAPGSDVEVWAAGLRNAFGLVYTTKSRTYATDNGPNSIFGAASTGSATQDPGPYDDDEINLIEWGNYYGSPNRNRGRTDTRQNIYRARLRGPASIPNTFTQMIAWTPPSSDGIDEYRSDTFQGQMRGNLIIQEYLNKMRRVVLRPDGRSLSGQSVFEPNTNALSCVTCPGGTIISLDFLNDEIEVFEPDDLSSTGLVLHDVFPWRGPAVGGTPFVIAGIGFGNLDDTSVSFGGNSATLTEVTSKRIRGTVPAELSPTTDLVDIVVTVDGISDDLPDAYRYLYGPGLEPGRWETLDPLPVPLGEVSAGVVDGSMYLVGEGTGQTYRYDCLNRQWLNNVASRPFKGHHHGVEVLDGKLYLIGGLGAGSEGKLQIYDPLTDQWSLGADMPWVAGSPSTAAIEGKIYVAGGIVSTFTVGTAAVYDPVLDNWTIIRQMPNGGRNHTAAATDGNRFYIFGGRRAGNFVTNGYSDTFVYDPASNTWDWSGAISSTLAPIPEARGGMNKAVYLRGEFYVFGGETLDDPDALPGTRVYDRVDVYSPATNSWRSEQPMLTPRHGICPVLFQGHIFLPGGGTVAGGSQSTIFDSFTRQ